MPSISLLCVAAVLLIACAAAADGTTAAPVTIGHPDHQARGYMCRKGSSIQISPYTMVYMAGTKKITAIYAVPTHGRLEGWSGRRFSIPIRTVADGMAYLANDTLFGDAARRVNGRRGTLVEQKFRYTAPVIRNASGYPLEFPLGRPMDWFNVSITYVNMDGRPHIIDTDAAIDVVNAAPFVVNPEYSIVNRQPRWIPLALADPDASSVAPLQEITSAWISASADLSVFPCRISFKEGEVPIDWSKTPVVNISTTNAGFWVVPPPDFGEGSQCLLNLTIADMNQQVSETVQVRLHAEAAAKPRAYNSRARLRRKEVMVPVDLIGSSKNIGPTRNMAFVLTKLPDPKTEGSVYFVQSTDNANDDGAIAFKPNETSVVAYNGTSRRLRLYFRRANAKVNFNTATIQFYVDDGFRQSDPAQVTIVANLGDKVKVTCEPTRMEAVFQDRSRSVPLHYRYEGPNPNGVAAGHFDRLQLLVVPNDGYGDLVQVMNTAAGPITRKLKVGDYFIDNSTQLLYVPNVNRSRVTSMVESKYKYRAISENGKSCSAWITVVITPHDNPSSIVDGLNIRLERARANELTMISLRGVGNRSVGILDSAIFTRVTKFGKLFTVNSRAPVNTVSLYTGIGPTMRPFCRQFNCSNFLGVEIKPGDEIKAVNDTRGGKQILVLYVAPPTITEELKSELSKDTALYTFKGLTGETTEQKLDILVVKGRRPRLYYYFDPPVRTANFSSSPDVRVPVAISDSDHAVEIMPFSIKENRRGIAAPFRLFQLAGYEGTEVKLGDKLTAVDKYGRSAQWLTNNNTVVLIGATRAFRRVYQFRATVYKKIESADGTTIDPNSGVEYRIIVQQRASAPSWDYNSTTVEAKVVLGNYAEIVLSVKDDADNLIAFRLIEGPKYGRLRVSKAQMGVLTNTYLDPGMVFRVSRGSLLMRQASLLTYEPTGGTLYTYPLTDRFVVAADNGMGILSEPLAVTVRVSADAQTLEKQSNERKLPNATYALAGVFVFMAAIVAATVMIIRRRRWESYTTVPTNERGNAPHPGVNS